MKTVIIMICSLCLPVCGWATESFWTAYFEAENFTAQTGGNKASTEYFPYIGDGYIEMGGQGAAVTWNNITVPKAGKYTLILKYANNTEQDRPCDIKVNGTLIKNISFGPFPKNWEVIRPEATQYNPETVGWAKYWNARAIVDLKAGANTLELIATSKQGGPHIDNIGVSTAVSEPPAPIINVKDHGAVGDGTTDNTAAIANAIAACPAGGSVVFDEGVYMTGSITLKANMTLWISENAVLRNFKGNDKIKTYSEGSFQGGYITRYFMFGNHVDNLTITGGGTIDLNTTERLPGKSSTRRPSILGWVNSEDVTVTNVDLINGDFWAFVPQKSDRIVIDGVNVFNINKDGIAPIDCHNISITNCVISSGDDAMVPKSYDASKGLDNLVVKNLTINFTRWKGFKYGGSTKGDFTNSVIEDVAMVHTHSGLALYAMSGCNVTNIKFNRIKMNNVQTPFFIVRDAAASTDTAGMRDIHISNFEVRNVYGQEGSSIQGTERNGTVYPIKNIYLSNVSVKDFKGGLDTVPETPREFPGRYPETTVFGTFPAWGYYIRHAENVVFTNVTHGVSPEDARKAIVLEDVTGFENKGQAWPLPAKTNYRRGMTMTKPSERWQDALPAGNGQVGALVYGSVNAERILFNHNELWYGGRIADVPDMSEDLDVVRKLMLEGKYVEANGYYSKKMRGMGFKGSNARYHPAFDMLVSTDKETKVEDYARTVNFETGEIEVTWREGDTRFSRKLFVSIPDDVSVMSITANKSGAVNGRVTLDIHDLKDALDRRGRISKPDFTYKTLVDGDFIEFRADGSDGGEFGGVLRVLNTNGKATGSDAAIDFFGAEEVVLLVGFFANEPSDTAVPRLKKQLGALSGSYQELFRRHAKMHRAKFNAMELTLNPKLDTTNEQLLQDVYENPASTELVQKMFDYGRYLLVSGSRGGSIPMGLQGIWNGDYYPAWAGMYGINENLQMAYWQALPGNLEDSMMAFYDYFDAHLNDFRYNAKQLWGCRGIYIPPFMSPESGRMRHTSAHVIHWTDAAGWLASFYYDYYLFTGDEEFLRTRAVPFMKEVALFYEDYIVKGEDGKNMLYPSQSPENVASNMMKDRVKVQMNSTVAFAISKEVFNNLIQSCELLDIEQDGVKRWKKMLADMPDYQVNKDGAIREWMHPDFEDNYEHRHQSHVYPVFPGNEVTEESNPEIYEACRVAIEKRLVIGLQSQTGWSMAHMANVYARLGDGKRAMDALNILSSNFVGVNLFTYHDGLRNVGVKTRPIAPFQIDANCGIPAAVMEMLCGSTSDMLRILPALPTAWSTGEFDGMLTRAGARASTRWDMEKKTIELKLTAMRDNAFNLKFPGEVAKLTASRPEAVSASRYGNRYRSVKLEKGDELKLSVQLGAGD